jgi:hypothetical protein
MSRPRKPQTSTDVELEIRRLLEAKQRLVADEDQRRGALLREYLAGRDGDALRAALAPMVGARDAYLFGIATSRGGRSPERPDAPRASCAARTPATAPA